MAKNRLVLASLCALSAGCGLPFGGDSGSGGGLDDGGVAAATGCKGKYDKDRTASEACCPEWGVDACGAHLFCAAFDGRQQPTCYEEYSRVDQAACTEDRQCQSRQCNVGAGKCKSTNFAPCDAAVGCADDSRGWPARCVQSATGLTCKPLSSCGSGCIQASECFSNACSVPSGYSNTYCGCVKGDACGGSRECSDGTSCVSGFCQ